MQGVFSRRLTVAGTMACALLLWSAPASAQTGMIKGKVLDAKVQPVEGARVVMEFLDGVNRRFETKTNQRGEFIQIGLLTGQYKLTADKDGMSQAFDATVRTGQTAEVTFQLVPGQGGSQMSKEDAAKMAALKTSLDMALAANKAGNYDEAIAKFNEAVALRPDCASCYVNIGYAHMQKKEYDNAEAAYKKAIELKPDSAEAYSDLANLYNAQKKYDLAAAASDQATKLSSSAGGAAGGAASPDILYNQAVILWNSGKIPDAKKVFEEVVKLNPNHADAHYQLGMANLNEGKMAEAAGEFETYLKLAPDGQFAAQAKGVLGQIKK